jgi:hypothetical protein
MFKGSKTRRSQAMGQLNATCTGPTRTAFSESPTHLLYSSGPLTVKKFRPKA